MHVRLRNGQRHTFRRQICVRARQSTLNVGNQRQLTGLGHTRSVRRRLINVKVPSFCNWASEETLYTPAMSKPSPGPGWWLDSDGNWYPQKWEYRFAYHAGPDGLEKMRLEADSLGQQGWEMVSLTYHTGPTAAFKRPLAP